MYNEFLEYPHLLGNYLGYDRLTQIHSDWIKKAWTENFVLQAHRNSYKTTAVLVVGSIWYLLFNHNARILIVRKNISGASAILQQITKHYETPQLKYLYELFFKFTGDLVTTSNNTKLELALHSKPSKEANLEAMGKGGSLTGSHYDKVMADDIITIKDRISRAERESTKSFIMELQNIPELETGTITVTGTPWHPEDAYSILTPADRYPVGTTNIPQINQKFISEIRDKMTASLFAANYELKHIADEGRIFPEPIYGKWPQENAGRDWNPIGWVDPSYKGSNTTSLTIIVKHNEKWYGKGYVWPDSVIDCYSRIVNIMNENKAGTLYIETNADQEMSYYDLLKLYPSVQGEREKDNKHNKIISYGKQHFRKIIWDENCQPEYMSQILDYQEGQEPDDAPDGFASLMRKLGFSGNVFTLDTIGADGIVKQDEMKINAAVDFNEMPAVKEWGLFK